MICPKCGMENADGATFCTSCGSAMNPAPVEDTVPASVPVTETVVMPVTEEAPKKDLMATAKSLLEPVKAELEKAKPMLEKVKPFIEKNKLFVLAGAGVVALLLCVVLLVAIFGGGNGYDAYKHTILVDIVDEEVVIMYDAKKVKKTGLDATGIVDSQASMDGSIVAILTDEGDLAVIKGTKLTKVDEEVEGFVLSVDGTGIAYVLENDESATLKLYNVKTKKAKNVTNWLEDDNIALAPNGDSVAYYEMKASADEPSLMFFKGNKSTKVTSAEVELVGISNNGKFIYTIGEDDEGTSILYSYNKKGDRDKIGKCDSSEVYFNEDHTQIAYFNSDGGTKTYISIKGKEGKKIASSAAYPLLPDSVQGHEDVATDSITLPTKTLFNKVYTCYGDKGESVWFIRKNTERSEKLVGNVDDISISEDCKYVYYVDDEDLKVLTVKKGDNAADKAKVIAEDVDTYLVTSNGKKIYYVSDESLFCANAKNGKGKKTIASDDVESSLAKNAKDVVYYMSDGDLYASKNGSKGKKVLSDSVYFFSTSNGVVYAYTMDSVYATKGAKKPAKIFTND